MSDRGLVWLMPFPIVFCNAGCRGSPAPEAPAPPEVQPAVLPEAVAGAEEGIKMTVVVDNYPDNPRLRTAWGFSCLVEGLDETILFDTGGNGDLLLSNMDELGIDPGSVDVVVLSHAHGDHTGGLAALLERHSEVAVYVLRSFPATLKQAAGKAGAECVEVTERMQICEGAWSTGEVGTSIPEQALAVSTNEGTVVITGCAHPGVVEMVRAAKEVQPEPVHAVIGGFHMSGVSEQRVREVIDQLKGLGVAKAGPCHCSGDQTRAIFQTVYGEGYIPVGAGTRLEFQPPD
jgi:7,8-dihydropterin-6-yl-methyl-4-(beta-D-ribofuranosyl)aminobenzene 5'-phosphate synthase